MAALTGRILEEPLRFCPKMGDVRAVFKEEEKKNLPF